MRVIVGGETSGVVREAFRRKGHEAFSCDLRPCSDGSRFHLLGDMRVYLRRDGWDLAILHPDCTYLCSSGLHWNGRVPGRAEKTAAALDFVRELMAVSVDKVAIENPVGCIGTQIRPADQYIQPFEYGHDASKKTGLWLKNLSLLPPPDPDLYVHPRLVCSGCGAVQTHPYGLYACGCGSSRWRPRWGNQTDSGQNRLSPSDDRWQERSRTYEGIAAAMVAAWG